MKSNSLTPPILSPMLTFDEIKDPDAEFWCTLETVSPGGSDECFVPLRV